MKVFLLFSTLLLGVTLHVDGFSGLRHSSTIASSNTQTEVEYPESRYIPWDEVELKEAAEALGFEEYSWNNPGTAPIEGVKFSNLNATQTSAAESLGFTELSWDCYQIHFFWGYEWPELEETGYHVFWEALGWNQSIWEGNADPPESLSLNWNSLNDEQKEAASSLCYFKETWDQVDISLWDEIRAIENNEELASMADVTDNLEEVEYPALRYVPWSEVEPLEAVQALGYTKDTWNNPGTAPIEGLTFSNLNGTEAAAAERLGFTELSWDCYQIHFFWGYDSWLDLKETGYHVFWEALGWNQSIWLGIEDPPESLSLNWNSLNDEQKEAASSLCYFKETWDQVDISLWDEIRAIENNEELASMADVTDNLEEVEYPALRYVPWSEVEPLEAAQTLGYTKDTWNIPMTARVEELKFSDLNGTEAAAAKRLGFTELSWNCYQIHYFWGYNSWLDLKETGYHVFWEALGWNVLKWQGYEEPPETEDLDWGMLNENQREAARNLCFFEETWDQVNITLWNDTEL